MSRLVVSEFVTIDGVCEDPGGAEGAENGGWAFQFDRGPEGDKFKLDEVMAGEALLLGRVTYEGFAAAWPQRSGPFADQMNGMPKYVVSSTLREPAWNNTTVLDWPTFAERVRGLKQDVDGDLLVAGSGQLVQALAEHDLVDEYRLMVFPTILGRGKRLFEGLETPTALQLAGSQTAGETLILTFGPRSVG